MKLVYYAMSQLYIFNLLGKELVMKKLQELGQSNFYNNIYIYFAVFENDVSVYCNEQTQFSFYSLTCTISVFFCHLLDSVCVCECEKLRAGETEREKRD